MIREFQRIEYGTTCVSWTLEDELRKLGLDIKLGVVFDKDNTFIGKSIFLSEGKDITLDVYNEKGD